MTQAAQNLNQADNELKIIFTTEEIRQLDIPCIFELKEPETCKFCGKKLYYEGICFMGSIATMRAEPQRCTCDKAKEYWKRKDAEAAKKEAIEEAMEQQRKRQDKIEWLTRYSKIRRKYQNCSFENYQIDVKNKAQIQAFKIAKNYAENYAELAKAGKGLYIEGTYGTGKTHLACAIALTIINQFRKVICMNVNDLLSDIKETFNNSDKTEDEVLKRYKNVGLLIIDDLGKETATNWSVGVLYSIINCRYENMKPTIITTNYNEDMLTKRMTPQNGDSSNIKAIISRLRKTTDVITMAWEDYRSKQH